MDWKSFKGQETHPAKQCQASFFVEDALKLSLDCHLCPETFHKMRSWQSWGISNWTDLKSDVLICTFANQTSLTLRLKQRNLARVTQINRGYFRSLLKGESLWTKRYGGSNEQIESLRRWELYGGDTPGSWHLACFRAFDWHQIMHDIQYLHVFVSEWPDPTCSEIHKTIKHMFLQIKCPVRCNYAFLEQSFLLHTDIGKVPCQIWRPLPRMAASQQVFFRFLFPVVFFLHYFFAKELHASFCRRGRRRLKETWALGSRWEGPRVLELGFSEVGRVFWDDSPNSTMLRSKGPEIGKRELRVLFLRSYFLERYIRHCSLNIFIAVSFLNGVDLVRCCLAFSPNSGQ